MNNIIEYISHWGSDLMVVNAARVSMGKEVSEFSERDTKLINYLASHRHMSPFRHCGATFRLEVPIFIMRQFQKHRVGVEINEISGRYVEFEETYWSPKEWRLAAPNVKQGSSENCLTGLDAEEAFTIYEVAIEKAFESYKALLSLGVCKEQARAVLPLSLHTQAVVSMSLEAAAHFCSLRLDPHAQKEIQEVAQEIDTLFKKKFPVSWDALRKE